MRGVLKKKKATVEVKNSLEAIKLPFSVMNGGETRIVLDLEVLDLSDHPPRGYKLYVEGYEIYNDGKLVDKIPG